MEYREEITPEMQLKWFESIDNESNNYYIIREGSQKIGLIYGANIDWEKMETGNGGIFIANEEYWNTNIPIASTLLLMEISFMLGLKRTFIKVMRDNQKAIEFNQGFGYQLLDGQEGIINQKYVLTPDSYKKSTQKLREILEKLYSNKIEIIIQDAHSRVSALAIDEYKKRYHEVKDRVKMYIGNALIVHE